VTSETPVRTRRSKGNVKAQKARARERHYFRFLARHAAWRCRAKGLPFDLDEEHLRSLWVDTCPALGIPLTRGTKGPGNAELDRFVPALGYTKGNVSFISSRANRIKVDATPEELRKVAAWASSKQLERTSP
jgi:hypothetical protein